MIALSAEQRSNGPFADHPDRSLAQAEIHARPISPITTPARVRRVAFLLGADGKASQAARVEIERVCRANGTEPPDPSARRFSFATAEHRVTWEFHTEFFTVTWISRFDDSDPWPAGLGLEALGDGRVAVAVRLDVVASATISPAALAGFDPLSLCYSQIEGRRAEIATDFVVDRYGYTRYELAAGDIGPNLLGAIVRRVLEIETYRVLALIGVALARSIAPTLASLEARLNLAMADMGSPAAPSDSHALLEAMHALQVEAAHSVEDTRYRFGASRAYGAILSERLANLEEEPRGEHRTLERYLHHRLNPALATFEALEKRQTMLIEQMTRSTALLGTRISLDIQNQNRVILETISDTAQSQYSLQRTVEGLSTIAISYYVLGIASYALHVLDERYEHEKQIAIAVLAPLIVLAIWLFMRRMHHKR